MTYRRGADFERKVRDRLYADGAKLVVRSAGSKGPVDLVALYGSHPTPVLAREVPRLETGHFRMWGDEVVFPPDVVQVKTGTARLSSAKRAELVSLAESVGARAVLASPVKNGRRIDVKLEVLA